LAKVPEDQSDMQRRMAMPKGAELKNQVVQAATERLLGEQRRIPNVVGFGHGVKWTNNQPTGKDALLVFVEQKVDVPSSDRVPSEIGGKPTDVVPVGTVMAQQLMRERSHVDRDGVMDGEAQHLASPQRALLRLPERDQSRLLLEGLAGQELEVGVETLAKRARPARGGYSVGHFKITAGTISTCVYDFLPGATVNPPAPGIGVPSKCYILSNNHVLANSNAAAIGDPILQPGPFDGGTDPADRIARLSRFVPITFEPPVPRANHRNLVDAAIAEGEFHDLEREVYWTGVAKGWYPRARLKVGDRVKKTGRTTNYTLGRVIATNATIDVNYGGGKVARFLDQILTTSMSAGGDSGSLVLSSAPGSQPGTQDDFAVGLLFAGSPQVTIANHFEHVRALLRIEVYP
jgi:hypothetical protein